MTLSNLADIATIIGATAIAAVSIQVLISYKQFKADHERGRREKTVDLLLVWDSRLKKEGSHARRLIESLNSEQCREVFSEQQVAIPVKFKKIVLGLFAKADIEEVEKVITLSESQVSELRWHVLSYLNSLESVMIAWQYSIVDRGIIEDQFSYLFSPANGHEILKEFRAATGGEDTYPAIEVFVNHLKEVRKNKLVQKAKVA